MRDPHVISLLYQISSEGIVEYRNPDNLLFENHLGVFNLVDDKLMFKPHEHFSTEQDALYAIEPFLKSWEMEADLTSNIGTIRFTFEKSNIIDRNPPKAGESIKGEMHSSTKIAFGLKAEITAVMSKFPNPPRNFGTSENVEMAYRRWLGYKNNSEPLQSMSYFVLTILLESAGGQKNAARSYNIDTAILRKLGELSSTKGDATTARKAGAVLNELTPQEKQWIEEAVKKMIYQMGVYVSGLIPEKLEIRDLPQI